MPSAAELKAELRALRKEHVHPVSRMRVADIASEIQKLKGMREETPAVAATPSAPIKKSRAAVETIKEAKQHEFPMQPDDGVTAAPKKGAKVPKAPKNVVPAAVEKTKVADKKMKEKLAQLLGMME